MTLRDLLPRLRGVRPSGSGYVARCSAHDDQKASLSIAQRDGRILLKCHAGRPVETIVKALGLELSLAKRVSGGRSSE